jgi:opacity protein-like surface antigen
VRCLLLLVACTSAIAADCELGANLGYGIYRNGTIYGAGIDAQAGMRNRFSTGIDLTYDFSQYVAAQFAYLYHDGHPYLSPPGGIADIQGQSHALTVGMLFHFRRTDSRLRPFVSGATGAKGYIIAGPEPFPQPFPSIASLTENDVWKVVFSVGGGVRYRLSPRVMLRAEFRDYLTTFPRQQIVPAPHNTARGIFEQFTPLFGIGYVF